jgi:chromate transport protein ChrA
MLAAGLGATHMEAGKTPDWMIGLAPAATVLIFVAFFRLGKKVADSQLKAALALASACATLLIQNEPRLDPRSLMWVLPVMLVCGGALTLGDKHWKAYRQRRQEQQQQAAGAGTGAVTAAAAAPEGAMGSLAVTSDTYSHVPVSHLQSLLCFALVGGFLLFLLGFHLAGKTQPKLLHIFASFFIVGATIYGGGQVMLPLLVGISVDHGWLT